ncbi:hypothetical protein L207DRAFT_89944 [Hyaloscypha variabilis F]|uniref:Secreted protein n=1 Tax=Hyaloscypha variabilis (strain UAMH 11265 / GT02V1 / F) TaxID=1149755 RepID=A0A2J6RE54_HYAVF|nr:hypothetical protein L207DRAFT_89944 [Hyaloscypha variabilis F]
MVASGVRRLVDWLWYFWLALGCMDPGACETLNRPPHIQRGPALAGLLHLVSRRVLQCASVFWHQSWEYVVVYLQADCAEWDGFRVCDDLVARGSLLKIRSRSPTPSGEIACL